MSTRHRLLDKSNTYAIIFSHVIFHKKVGSRFLILSYIGNFFCDNTKFQE